MLAMHRDGASSREIAEAIGLTHPTIAAWLQDAGLKPNGGAGARNGRRRKEPDGPAPELAEAAREIVEVGSAPLPRDRATALAHVQARLRMASKLIEQQAAGLPTGASNPATLVKLGQWERELRSEIAELTPHAAPDPATDPTILEAAAEVRRQIESQVREAEENSTCIHCGKNPFGL